MDINLRSIPTWVILVVTLLIALVYYGIALPTLLNAASDVQNLIGLAGALILPLLFILIIKSRL